MGEGVHMTQTAEKKNAYRVSLINLKEGNHLEYPGVDKNICQRNGMG
jgi:hypothetical protein